MAIMAFPRRYKGYLNGLAIVNLFLLFVFILNMGFSEKKKLSRKERLGLGKYPAVPMMEAKIMKMDQEEVRLINWIRKTHLRRPSRRRGSIPGSNRWNWYSHYVLDLFVTEMRRTPGLRYTFVDVGAGDGLIDSSSLFLEELGWTGLLIECNTLVLPKLITTSRKAWISDTCISPDTKPKLMNITSYGTLPTTDTFGNPLTPEELKLAKDKNQSSITYEKACFPLYSIMKAAMITVVSFLRLDVGGVEIDVLKGLPFHKIIIKVIIVELHTFSKQQRDDLRLFLQDKGYKLKERNKNDDVYVIKSDPQLNQDD